jgi:non-canonical (house-cleaning) NTP pyrophosphatase
MEKIFVAVGSTRRPKLNAVTEAAKAFASVLEPGAEFEIAGFDVESGVGHTPSSCTELMHGARQRAEALLQLLREKSERWSYFIGLEGGLDVIEEGAGRRIFLESWAYVCDGTRGHFGRSGGVELPEALAHEVLDHGVELSAAVDRFAVAHDPGRFAGAVGIRDAQGAWGVLTGNLMTRQEAFRVAVIAAFAPFYNARMYRSAGAAR